jgi:drug/metabolite transporter (DMT)-like permease
MPAALRSPSRLSARQLGIGAAIVTVVVWTAFILIARASTTRTLGSFDLVFVRICGASLVLVPWGAWQVAQARRRAPGAPHGSVFGLSPLGWRLTVVGGFFGGLYAPAAHASVLLPGSLPLWTSLLAVFVLRDRITPARALGLALIVVGDVLVGGRSLLQAFDGGEVWKGDLLFMSAAFCWACYSVFARRHGLDAVRTTIAITVFAFVVYVPAYVLLVAFGRMTSRLDSAPASEILFQMAFQGVGSVVISGIAFTRMIEYFGPVRSTMITALVPGLSAIGAVMLLDEPLYWNLVAGLLLVTAGILFGVKKAAPAASPTGLAHTPARPPHA